MAKAGIQFQPKDEVWRTIVDFPEYEVSSFGNIRRIGTTVKLKFYTQKGYSKIELYHNGKGYKQRVHRLVAKTFIPNPENKPQVNHIDFNLKNNSIDNLEWVTNLENVSHALKMRKLKKENNG